jgi:hypothetical protein
VLADQEREKRNKLSGKMKLLKLSLTFEEDSKDRIKNNYRQY